MTAADQMHWWLFLKLLRLLGLLGTREQTVQAPCQTLQTLVAVSQTLAAAGSGYQVLQGMMSAAYDASTKKHKGDHVLWQ